MAPIVDRSLDALLPAVCSTTARHPMRMIEVFQK
jgi:hypothetical protein